MEVETKDEAVETSPQIDVWQGPEIAPLGNIFMDCNLMDDFIRKATCHVEQCKTHLARYNTRCTTVREEWMCPVCNEKLQLLSSNRMKTKKFGEGAGVARSQPEINLRILHRAVQLESTEQKFAT